jgi:hypothetical protein
MTIVDNVAIGSQVPKKRGRKSKKELEEMQREKEYNLFRVEEKETKEEVEISSTPVSNPMTSVPKKRGRKPKGGKIIQQPQHIPIIKELKPNVILHLKCFMKDLKKTDWDGLVGSFYFLKNDSYEIVSNKDTDNITLIQNNTLLDSREGILSDEENEMMDRDHSKKCIEENEEYKKDICKKLKKLQYDLHNNNVPDNKSACFWCTYTFENPTIYIPKSCVKVEHQPSVKVEHQPSVKVDESPGKYSVYGCFCSPECAVSYLMSENIDTSVKFERYALLNSLYSKIYNYTEVIKPAPDPHYLLEKFYGKLTIQEYRSSFKKDRLFLVLNKPLTHILPELIEDKDALNIHNITISNKKINIAANANSYDNSTGGGTDSATIPKKKKVPFF